MRELNDGAKVTADRTTSYTTNGLTHVASRSPAQVFTVQTDGAPSPERDASAPPTGPAAVVWGVTAPDKVGPVGCFGTRSVRSARRDTWGWGGLVAGRMWVGR